MVASGWWCFLVGKLRFLLLFSSLRLCGCSIWLVEDFMRFGVDRELVNLLSSGFSLWFFFLVLRSLNLTNKMSRLFLRDSRKIIEDRILAEQEERGDKVDKKEKIRKIREMSEGDSKGRLGR